MFRDVPPVGVADSKALSAKRRESLIDSIFDQCWVGVGIATADEIDAVNILQATFLAMERAVAALPVRPERIVVDGNRLPRFEGFDRSALEAMVKGDALCPQISAASIVAKVMRDRRMLELDALYPGYGFAKHAGYGVAAHMAALQSLGPCPEHRKSFAPVRALL
jgi:ribonuclease HII